MSNAGYILPLVCRSPLSRGTIRKEVRNKGNISADDDERSADVFNRFSPFALSHYRAVVYSTYEWYSVKAADLGHRSSRF